MAAVSSSLSPEYFKQALLIKDKNIEDLLRELRETSETYQRIKGEYVKAEQQYEATIN